MNLLFVISSLADLAPVKVLFDIISNMDNHNISVLTLKRSGSNSLINRFKSLDVDLIHLDYSHLYCEIFNGRLQKKIERIIEEKKIDLVHCNCYNSVIACANIKNIRKYLTFHNFCYEDYVYSKGYFLGRYMSKRFLNATKKFNSLIAISTEMVNYYQEALSRKIDLIHNGVNINTNSPVSDEEKNNLRVQLSLPNKVIITVCGRLIRRKNPTTIIKAFNQVTDDNLFLIIIGDGPLLHECKSLANMNPNIRFEGFVNEPQKYLKASDILISASFSEGFPLNVLEALSIGLPLLLSNIPPHHEIKEMVNKYGCVELFDPYCELNIMGLVNKVLPVYLKQRLELNRFTEQNFSNIIMSQKYSNIFKE